MATVWNPPQLNQLTAILASQWKKMVIGAVLGLLVAVIALACATPRYTVSSSVLLQMGREMSAPPTLNGQLAMPAEKRPEDIATAVEMMSGQDIIEQVVNSFGEDYFYAKPPAVTTMQKIRRGFSDSIQTVTDHLSSAFSSLTGKRKLTRLEKVVVAIQKDLTVESARRSDVINITLITTDPDKGRQLVDRFIAFYREKHLKAYDSPHAREFFESEHDRLGRDLKSAEDAMIEYKARQRVYSGEDQRRLLLTDQAAMQSSYNQLQIDIARVTAELHDLDQTLANLPDNVPLQSVQQRNPLLDTLRGKLADAEASLAKIKTRYTDDSRPVLDATNEVNLIRDQLKKEQNDPFVTYSETAGASDVRKALVADQLKERSVLDGLKAQSELKRSQLQEIAARLTEVDAADMENSRRQRDIQLMEQSYKLYAKNLEDARIAEEMDTAAISNIAVIENPTASLVPTYPPTMLWLAAGAVLGAGLPVGWKMLRDGMAPRRSPLV